MNTITIRVIIIVLGSIYKYSFKILSRFLNTDSWRHEYNISENILNNSIIYDSFNTFMSIII